MNEKFDWKVYAPYFLGVIFACSLLSLWFVTSLAVDNVIVPESYKIFFTGLFGILTTVMAVILSYYVNTYQKNKEAEKKLIKDLQSTLFLLSAKLYQLRSFYKSNLEPHYVLSAEERTLNIFAYLDLVLIEKFDLVSLTPLQEKLGSSLLNLLLLDESYITAHNAISNRSDIICNKITPIYDSWLEKNKDKKVEVFYLKFFPVTQPRLFKEITASTNNCYEIFPYAIAGYEGMLKELLKLARESYKDTYFYDLEHILKVNTKQ